jgi:hypothetical protein
MPAGKALALLQGTIALSILASCGEPAVKAPSLAGYYTDGTELNLTQDFGSAIDKKDALPDFSKNGFSLF